MTRRALVFQSTHPARGATTAGSRRGTHQSLFQSTHPARGATPPLCIPPELKINFNPRTPRGVRRQLYRNRDIWGGFQSTHPARGATAKSFQRKRKSRISIHAPREGCDSSHRRQFQAYQCISIHAPREGCDLGGFTKGLECGNFNPRTPRGVRPGMSVLVWILWVFQSTHPARGAT